MSEAAQYRPPVTPHPAASSSYGPTKSGNANSGVAGKYGAAERIVYHEHEPLEEQKALRVKDLIRPPIIRQVSPRDCPS